MIVINCAHVQLVNCTVVSRTDGVALIVTMACGSKRRHRLSSVFLSKIMVSPYTGHGEVNYPQHGFR